jgi:perosamine synthetase
MSERFIPLSAPVVRGNEWRYVKECLDTAWLSSAGPQVERFEQLLAERIGRRHAVATVNGTAALHLALQTAGVAAGDEVVVPALSFAAPANAVRYLGAFPAFVDVDDAYLQIDPVEVERFLVEGCERRGEVLVNRRTGRTVRALLPVHVLGHPAPMEPLMALAAAHGLEVIEDGAESLGARYCDQPVGRHGRAVCLSFNGNKIVTTGGGGMIVTDDEAMARRAAYLSTQAKDDPVEYVHAEIGYNYRLTSVQAAIGIAQLELLDEYVAARRAIARRYREGLADLPGVSTLGEAPWATSTFWLSTIRIGTRAAAPVTRPEVRQPEVRQSASRRLMAILASHGIQSRPLWHPLHRLAPFQGCFSGPIQVADRAYAEALSLPSSADLDEADQDRVIDLVRTFIRTGHTRA